MPSLSSTEIDVDGTFFSFPDDWTVSTFDDWQQFRVPAGVLGMQGVDIVAIDGDCLWLIEMKDYTYPGGRVPENLAKVLGQKAIGTMALLYALERSAFESEARAFAARSRDTSSINLAIHVDVKHGGRKATQIQALLMPLQSEIRRTQKSLGLAKAWVTSTLAPNTNTPWTARRNPSRRHLHEDR